MARKKIEFKPDRTGSGILNKLYMPPAQRLTVLKWTLYSLLFVLALVVQDSMLSRFSLFGGVLDLAACVIVVVCVVQGAYAGSLFVLLTSLVYVFSGSAPGSYAIAFLTVYATLAAAFRQSYLRWGFSSAWLCSAIALALYEFSVFGMGLFLGLTHLGRAGAFAMTTALSCAVMPLFYWLIQAIGKIGGETWKE